MSKVKKAAANPYKLQRVERAEEEPREEWTPKIPQPFADGQVLRCTFLPILYTIPEPVVAKRVLADKHFDSHWKVVVDDTSGREQELDSRHFKPHTA